MNKVTRRKRASGTTPAELPVEKAENGNGGDVTFLTGKPGSTRKPTGGGHPGDVVFKIGGGDEAVEMLRLRYDGAFLVRGKLVATDRDVYVAFRAWLAALGLW